MWALKNYFRVFLLFTLCGASSFSSAEVEHHKTFQNPEKLLILADQLKFTDVDAASSALNDAYNIAIANEQDDVILQVLLQQAHLALSQKDYFLAQQYLHRGEVKLKKYSNYKAEIKILSTMADVKRYLKQYDASQKYISKALSIAMENNNTDLLYNVFSVKGALAKSQNRHADALALFIEAEKRAQNISDLDKYSLLRNLAMLYSRNDQQESSARTYQRIIHLLKDMGHIKAIPETLLDLAVTQRKSGLYAEALTNAREALKLAKTNNDQIFELKSLVVLSIIYRRLGSYEDALLYALEAFTLYEDNSDYNGVASAANSIGLIYKHLVQYSNAKTYFERVIELPEDKIQIKYRASALRELGLIAFDEGENKQGILFSQQASALFKSIGDDKGAATVTKNLGVIYESLGQTDNALAAYQSAIEVFKNTGDIWNEGINKALLACLLAKESPSKAIDAALSSIEIADKTKAKSIYESAYKALVDAYEKQGNYKKALYYARLKEAIVAEIKKNDMNKRIAEISIVLDLEKKDKELQNYKRQQAITTLELNRKQATLDMLNKENEIESLESKNELFIGLIVLSFLTLGILLYRRKH